ncbi:hypothetical protein FACS189485_13380 [Spirochaetia bacterium]|nr:hypothetical protein FACS189485_13380 [Spirochaetia bacterium]
MKIAKNRSNGSGRNLLLAGLPGKAVVIAVLALGLVLTGCPPPDGGEEEETRSNPVLGETFEIKGKVYGESWDSAGISYTPLTNVTAVTVNGPFNTTLTAAIPDGSNFTVTIPAAVSDWLSTTTKENLASQFDLRNGTKITTFEPADARFGDLSFEATAPGYYSYLSLGTQSVSGTEENYSLSGSDYSYVYVDKDVTINGSDQDQGEETEDGVTYVYDYSTTVNLSLKAGWNVIERSSSESGKEVSATKYESKGTTTYSVKGILESAKWTLDSEDD